MAKKELPGSGGGDGDSVTASDFLNESANKLSGMVDWPGMLGTIIKSWFLAVASLFAGAAAAPGSAFEDLVDGAISEANGVIGTLTTQMAKLSVEANQAASKSLDGILAAPIGVIVVLAGIGAVVVVGYIFVSGVLDG